MFQAIPQTPNRDRPKVTHRGQIIQQKKVYTIPRITSDVIDVVLQLLKRNPLWFKIYDIKDPTAAKFPQWIQYIVQPLFDVNRLDIPQPHQFTEQVTISQLRDLDTIKFSSFEHNELKIQSSANAKYFTVIVTFQIYDPVNNIELIKSLMYQPKTSFAFNGLKETIDTINFTWTGRNTSPKPLRNVYPDLPDDTIVGFHPSIRLLASDSPYNYTALGHTIYSYGEFGFNPTYISTTGSNEYPAISLDIIPLPDSDTSVRTLTLQSDSATSTSSTMSQENVNFLSSDEA